MVPYKWSPIGLLYHLPKPLSFGFHSSELTILWSLIEEFLCVPTFPALSYILSPLHYSFHTSGSNKNTVLGQDAAGLLVRVFILFFNYLANLLESLAFGAIPMWPNLSLLRRNPIFGI